MKTKPKSELRQSKRPRIDFHIDPAKFGLSDDVSKEEVKEFLRGKAKKRDGVNISLMLNNALAWYVHSLDSKDKGLEKFLDSL